MLGKDKVLGCTGIEALHYARNTVKTWCIQSRTHSVRMAFAKADRTSFPIWRQTIPYIPYGEKTAVPSSLQDTAIDISQGGTLYVLQSARVEFGRMCHKCRINTAETKIGKLGKTHYQELVSTFEPDGVSITIVSLYAFVELISWHERHYLWEYCVSLIHDFCLFQYDLQKYKIKCRKTNVCINHWK